MQIEGETSSSLRWVNLLLCAICNLQFAICILHFPLSALLLSRAQAQESKAPLFDVHSAEGVIASASLEQVREDWSVSVGGKKVSGSDLVSLRQTKAPLPPLPRGERVVFSSGDQLPGTALELHR